MRLLPVLSILLILSNLLSAQTQPDLNALQYRFAGPMRGGRVTTVTGVASQPNVFYLGATGGGIWKTEDYGTTWKNISDGYFESPSIGAIRVAPSDPNIVYAGTGSDGLRSNVIAGKGVYKSVDAGKTWKNIGLRETGHIGAVEVHPTDHNIVFVAAIGQAFQPNSERGVFRTKNGGKTWEKVLFLSDTTGFVDLEFMPSNPNIIYAAAWRAERKPWTITSGGLENGIYKSEDGGETWVRLIIGLPLGIVGKIDLAVSPADSRVLYALVEAPGKQAGLYRSDDQGASFRQVSDREDLLNRPFYYCNVEADPKDADVVYVMMLRFLKSTDGGTSWTAIRPPHGDNHDLWINPNDSKLMIQANDGGANVSHNGGATWSSQFNQPTAELYQVEVDDQYPYWLYAGQQDNYTAIAVPGLPPGAHQFGTGAFVENVGGCETGPAVPKPGNPDIVYSNCKGRFRVFNKKTGQEQQYDVGGRNMYGHNPRDLKYRFQRVSPIHVSPHNPGVVYHCSQYVHRTTDEGKTWEIISPDLTAFEPDRQVVSGSPITRDITGEEFYSTIYAIRESPLEKGQIWVGANDGPVHVTRNGGQSWQKVTPKALLPGGRVDCVEPSPHKTAKAYIAVLRYQLGDWKPYIFKTTDYGQSWTLLTTGKNGIPADFPTRVVREDPDREGLLYAGTESGMYVSFDDGATWLPFQQNLPVTPVTDLKVYRQDLVLSTMGRGFWILDDLDLLHQQYDRADRTQPHMFKPGDAYRYRYDPSRGSEALPAPPYPRPGLNIDYFLPEKTKNPLRLDILNDSGETVRTFISRPDSAQRQSDFVRDMATNALIFSENPNLKNEKGLQRFRWDMRHAGPWDERESRRYQNGPMVRPGRYTLRLYADSLVLEQTADLLLDPRVAAAGVSLEDVQKQEALALQIVALQTESRQFLSKVKKMRRELESKAGNEVLTEQQQAQVKQLTELENQLATASGAYPQPMFLSQVNYLYELVDQADQVPGRDAYERFAELKQMLEEIKFLKKF